MPAGWMPRSETEKALKDSLRDMEIQCKERVDLLEALRVSRDESAATDASRDETNGKMTKKSGSARPSLEMENTEKREGYIGGGTVPAISYPDLSRPGPPLPQRPSLPYKNSSERAVVGRNPSGSNFQQGYEGSPAPSSSRMMPSSTASPAPFSANLAPPNLAPPPITSRNSSPDKGPPRTMRQTLRTSDKSGRPSAPKSRPSARKNDVTNKAATMAWQSGINGRDGSDHSNDARKDSHGSMASARPGASAHSSSSRSYYKESPGYSSSGDLLSNKNDVSSPLARSNATSLPPPYPSHSGPASTSMPDNSSTNDLIDLAIAQSLDPQSQAHPQAPLKPSPPTYPTYLREYPETSAKKARADGALPTRRKPATAGGDEDGISSRKPARKPVAANSSSPRKEAGRRPPVRQTKAPRDADHSSQSVDDDTASSGGPARSRRKQKQKEDPILADMTTPTSDDSEDEQTTKAKTAFEVRVEELMKNLPKGVDEAAAKNIFNEIVVQGDEVHWEDVAGLEIAKTALKEAVVYPFLRPDLFMGLREPARGMLLFGPPGTGKTMLARAVATESKSTFFSISASSLTSKYLGESEKLVRALFSLAKALAPSIIFVDEIDSLLSSRSGSGENEATRRIKTEFLIQWSDLQRAAAGREQSERERERGDASRVLVLAATNLPWAIDEAARRRFVRRQYIPLPEDVTRGVQLRTLLGHQKHSLEGADIERLIELTDGMSFPSLPSC